VEARPPAPVPEGEVPLREPAPSTLTRRDGGPRSGPPSALSEREPPRPAPLVELRPWAPACPRSTPAPGLKRSRSGRARSLRRQTWPAARSRSPDHGSARAAGSQEPQSSGGGDPEGVGLGDLRGDGLGLCCGAAAAGGATRLGGGGSNTSITLCWTPTGGNSVEAWIGSSVVAATWVVIAAPTSVTRPGPTSARIPETAPAPRVRKRNSHARLRLGRRDSGPVRGVPRAAIFRTIILPPVGRSHFGVWRTIVTTLVAPKVRSP
jgi:hypothetical protein